MFIPYLQHGASGVTSMVVAWVPKTGVDPEVDQDETEPPPPGAPAYSATPGPTGGGVQGVDGPVQLGKLQAQLDWQQQMMAALYRGAVYAAQGSVETGVRDYNAALPYFQQAFATLGMPLGDMSVQPSWNNFTSPTHPPPRLDASEVSGADDPDGLTPEERYAELGPRAHRYLR
jgi:hypothetical protein